MWTIELENKQLRRCTLDFDEFFRALHPRGKRMGRTHPPKFAHEDRVAPVFWAWAQQHAAPDEPLHLTRRRAIQMQLQADADLAKSQCVQ